MFNTTISRRLGFVVAPLTALMATVALATPAAAEAEQTIFFEETASSFWSVPHQCADGSTVQATLLVLSTRDFETPETEDADPTARVQYQAVCSGSSFSWVGILPATITSTENLKSVTATGSGRVRDNLGVFHDVTFDVAWTAVGALQTSTRTFVSEGFRVTTTTRKEREAVADGRVTFDGTV
ncbi:MAG: hypothetical protein ACRDUV_23285, partial [Pseudonocardiaceae bacterium]